MAQLTNMGNALGAQTLRSRIAELTRNPSTRTVLVGVTAVALTPVVLPLVRPLLKSTIKSGVLVYEKAKGAIAETVEMVADVAAEARAEAHGITTLPATESTSQES